VVLKEPMMNAAFFYYFARFSFGMGGTISVLTYVLTCSPALIVIYCCLYRGRQSWPFDLVMKCKTIENKNQQLRLLRLRSDLLVSKSSLPRLLVEVNSNPREDWPEDLVRMLLTGAAVVRFANGHLDRFRVDKNFVLLAIYIWGNGEVFRYSLFQRPKKLEVCWTLNTTKLAC
jgi:hypothetical protein